MRIYNVYDTLFVLLHHYITDFREEEDQLKQWELMIAMHMNLALSYLKMNEGKEAKDHCDKVLEKEPKNVKALYRKGQVRT